MRAGNTAAYFSISEVLPFSSNSVFPDFLRLFIRKLRFIGLSDKKAYFNVIFYEGQVILSDRNNLRSIFVALSPFVSTLFTIQVVSRTAPEGLLLKVHYTPAF